MGKRIEIFRLMILVFFLFHFLLPAQNIELSALHHLLPKNIHPNNVESCTVEKLTRMYPFLSFPKPSSSLPLDLFYPSASQNWKPAGPAGGNVMAIAANPNNLSDLYILIFSNSSSSFVYKSSNAGKKWKKVATLNRGCYDIILHPSNPNILYALSSYSVFKSTNGGSSWNEHFLGSGCYGYSGEMAIHPQNPDILYVAGYHYSGSKSCMAVFKSTNGGVNWATKDINPSSSYGQAYSIALSSSNPNILYAGGYYSQGGSQHNKVYKSSDSGNSWKDVTGSISVEPNSIVVDPTDSNKVYVGTYWGVYRSTNGGQTWNKSPANVYAYALAIDPASPNTIYAGYSKNCYKSSDGGASWTEYKSGLFGNCNDLAALSGMVYYGSYAGIYKSQDAGITWKAAHSGINHNVVTAIAVAPSAPSIIYAEAAGNGLFKSTDSGISWSRLPEFYRCDSIYCICVNPNNAEDLFILAGG